MNIKELREDLGLSQSQFAKKFGIPVRTLQGWEIDRRKPPEYVVQMIQRIIELESKDDKRV